MIGRLAALARSRLSLAIKLTLVFVAVMAVVLAAIGSFLFFRTKANLDGGIRQTLQTRAGGLVAEIRASSGPDGPGPSIEPGERFAQVLTRTGRVLESRPQNSRPLLTPREAARVTRRTFIERGEETRLLAVPVRLEGRSVVAVVAASLADREHALEGLGGALLVGGPLALLLAAALAYWLATSALRPVDLMRERASAITAADLDARLPVPATHDEIQRLATTLNEMLARLAQAAEHERAFVANASHELRTPVATMRAELELALRHAGTVEQFRDAARASIRDADDLSRLADDLLVLARADSGHLPVRLGDVDVGDLLRGVADELAADAARAGRRVEVQAPEGLRLRADPDRLAQALRNMGVNALVHGAGTITLGADTDGRASRLWVSDEGSPLPAAALDGAFERFARGTAPSDRPGAGLGLSIVRGIAHAHGGNARLLNTPRGVCCVLELPAAPVAAAS